MRRALLSGVEDNSISATAGALDQVEFASKIVFQRQSNLQAFYERWKRNIHTGEAGQHRQHKPG